MIMNEENEKVVIFIKTKLFNVAFQIILNDSTQDTNPLNVVFTFFECDDIALLLCAKAHLMTKNSV